MKKIILLLLISFATVAQNDTTITKESIKKIEGSFYVVTETTTTTNVLVTSSMFSDIESKEEQKSRLESEIIKGDSERKEKVKLLKALVKKGFKPNADDWIEVEIYERVMNKIEKE
jgi:hypothetical protein